MHKRTYQIIKNLGYTDKVINQLKKRKTESRNTFTFLKKIGIPELAIKQIKFLENYPNKNMDSLTNKELIESLIKKCRRSLEAFASKGIQARIVFNDSDWVIYSDDYRKEIEKLHQVCKPYFDEWSAYNINVIFAFDGANWKVITKKESDLPGS